MKKAIWSLLGAAPLMLAGCMLDVAIPDGSNQAEFYIKALSEGQQTYYQLHGQFANSIENLAVNLNLDTEEYSYSLVSSREGTDRVEIVAATKKPELPSYTGVILMKKTSDGASAVVNVCQTENPAAPPPVMPASSNFEDFLKCPPGSRSISL